MTLFPQPRRTGEDVSLGGTTGPGPAAREISAVRSARPDPARRRRTGRSRSAGPEAAGPRRPKYCGRAPRPHPQFRRGAPTSPASAVLPTSVRHPSARRSGNGDRIRRTPGPAVGTAAP
ncbi:hypothetical protein YT1_0978 [Rhodococcus ruber]|nr:hypothetical protein YT1_0978 [Rhodococcus ruber]